MVRHFPHPGSRREEMREIAFPLGWVWPLAEAADRGGIKQRLDTAAHPARGFRLLGPDRIEHLHNKPSVDRRDRQFPQNGVDVSRQGVAPLLTMLGVAPTGFMTADEFLREFAEGSAPGCRKPLRLPVSDLCFERITIPP